MQAFLKTGKTTTANERNQASTSSGQQSGERRKPPAPWVEK